ncbi:MAG: fluoride efflux transporter CrcB [Xanthomonadales bacterium]|nr:fluoride efflux transporter CrcB [Xanthomonadales bacterium]
MSGYPLALLVVFLGAGCGACLRYGLGLWLNPLWTTLPLGTLCANLLGGFLVGCAVQGLALTGAAPLWRLALVTGFLGGLTTFSAFSAEVAEVLERGHLLQAGLIAGSHLIGSLALTLLGFGLARWVHG